MEKNGSPHILAAARALRASTAPIGVSSNEIRLFEWEGRRCVAKTPLMVGENLSPFWRMMKNLFGFTFEEQSRRLPLVYAELKDNPHIPVAELIAAAGDVMVYGLAEGVSREGDAFPAGRDNAYRLGQYVGWNHRVAHERCGLVGAEGVPDFHARMLRHMADCVAAHWNTDAPFDRSVRAFCQALARQPASADRYVLLMADVSADQFLYHGADIACCVDLDAYVIGPAAWELTLLQLQVADWDSFRRGYETYQPLPDFAGQSALYRFLLALNAWWDRAEMEGVLGERQ